MLLRALATVAHQWDRLTIVGDGPERSRLETLCRELGLDGHVHFAGALPHAETLARIGQARMFCLPARPAWDGDSDAMPVVIREAMARGVPVVASRLAGIPESVDEQVGWLVEPGSATSPAAALRAALVGPMNMSGSADRRVSAPVDCGRSGVRQPSALTCSPPPSAPGRGSRALNAAAGSGCLGPPSPCADVSRQRVGRGRDLDQRDLGESDRQPSDRAGVHAI